MIIFIVFVVVVAAIGLAAYGGSMVHDPITYIPHPECADCGVETDELSDYDGDGTMRCARCTIDYSFDRDMQGGMSL